ncbi:MAG: ABC transporter ATP-binding protein [Clostridia bacterium]|nr:ABC transporter ATP-binding protein [Clostridia bacterium]
MKLVLKYMKPMRAFVAVTLTVKVIATVIELFIPYVLSYILDYMVPAGNIGNVVIWGGVMLLFAVLACLTNIIANRMVSRIARRVTEKTRHELFDRILHLSSRQVDEFTIPSLESRLTSDTYNVHHFVGMSMRMGIRAPIMIVGGIIVTATLDVAMMLIMVITMPLIAIAVGLITKRGIPLFKKSQRSVDSMVRIVREDSQGIRVIKALSKVDYERRRFDKANKQLVSDENKAGINMAASNPIVTVLLNFGLAVVIVVGAYRVQGGLSETGKIIAFIQYFTMISNAMIGITRVFVNYSKGSASAQRIAEVIATEPDLCVESEDKHPAKNTGAHISFENVSFSYLGKKNNISDVSFELGHGETLGIIGATGSGKTTLAQLLMRFYDVDSGNVRIDGRDVRTIPHDELNTKFGVVQQNDFIYAGSIRDNIDFGRDLSDAEIERAAGLAQAEEFILGYDDKYEHLLNSKGTNLSGGQRQRLLISRALAGSPEILVLDDSSSALDYKTDAKLRRAIKEGMDGVTTIIVAQRVSSVMNADLIIVMDDGRIIGKGTHSELLESCSVYKEISDSQIGGAVID